LTTIRTIAFDHDTLRLIDQRKLPHEYEYFTCHTPGEVFFAIKDMVVRGAPAIGVAAAFGVALAAREALDRPAGDFTAHVEEACRLLAAARPTAVNLAWAVERQRRVLYATADLPSPARYERLVAEAQAMLEEDIAINRAIGAIGQGVIPDPANILTHCNTGALATAGYGTALGVIRAAHAAGKRIHVYADETRPRLQGARLTAWELRQEGMPATVIVDSAAASLMRAGRVDIILVGADRIAANGDTANKIGTYMLAVLAKEHHIPFYVVAPTSTIDFNIPSGEHIIIEERDPAEVTDIGGVRVATPGIDVYNPAFDVTPHEYITGIITEKGIIAYPDTKSMAELQGK